MAYCSSDNADTFVLRAAMVVVELEERVMLPLLSLLLTPRAVAYCSDDADTRGLTRKSSEAN